MTRNIAVVITGDSQICYQKCTLGNYEIHLSRKLQHSVAQKGKVLMQVQHSRYLENWYLEAGLDLEASDF